VHAESPTPRATNTIVVRPMVFADLDFATRLHLQYLNHGLFPALGSGFLTAYLRTFITSPSAIASIAERNGKPVGFLVGTLDDRSHYGYTIRRCGLGLALRGLIGLCVRPRVAYRFIKTRAFRYARGAVRLAGTQPTQAPSSRDAVLTHMAVVPTARSVGVGKKLAETFAAQVSESNAIGVALTTRAGAAGASGFYEKLGWCPVTEFVDRDGLAWQRLRLDLSHS
jgi:ribosomal protein S18 acetylase RimI-like enzyme